MADEKKNTKISPDQTPPSDKGHRRTYDEAKKLTTVDDFGPSGDKPKPVDREKPSSKE